MEDSSAKRLKEIEAREERASSGPWMVGRSDIGNEDDYFVRDVSSEDKAIAEIYDWPGVINEGDANADFIAHARADIPWLVKMLKLSIETIDSGMADHIKLDVKYRTLTDVYLRVAQHTEALEESMKAMLVTLRNAAEEAYQSEVIDTEMKDHLIGEGLEFADKEDWIEARISEWASLEEHKA